MSLRCFSTKKCFNWNSKHKTFLLECEQWQSLAADSDTGWIDQTKCWWPKNQVQLSAVTLIRGGCTELHLCELLKLIRAQVQSLFVEEDRCFRYIASSGSCSWLHRAPPMVGGVASCCISNNERWQFLCHCNKSQAPLKAPKTIPGSTLSLLYGFIAHRQEEWLDTGWTRAWIWHCSHLHSFPFYPFYTYCLGNVLYESSRDEEDWDLGGVERKRKKWVLEYLLSKLRGPLLLASPSLAFTFLTAPLAPFDIPSLCSATLQIPLSHLHSLKAQFHLSLSLSFFPYSLFLLLLQIGLFMPGVAVLEGALFPVDYISYSHSPWFSNQTHWP